MFRLREHRETCTAILRYADGRLEEIKEFPGVSQFMNVRSGPGFVRFELVWLSGSNAVYRQIPNSTKDKKAKLDMPCDITLERTLPQNVESEKAVLGAILLDEKAVFAASEILVADDFYLEAHREIFRAMLSLVEEDASIDLFTLREELRRRNKEEAAGGPAYLAALTDGLPRALNVGHYARTVREKAASRQLIGLANEMTSRCYRGEERPAEILERVESQIFQIASREIKGGFVYFGDIVNARDIRVRQLPGDPHFGEEALAAHGIFGELGRQEL